MKKYTVDWDGDGSDIHTFATKKKAYRYLEHCSGVFVQEVK